MSPERRYDISMHHVPVRGGIGAAILIAIVIAPILIRLPVLRAPLLAALVVGSLMALLLIWRRRAGLEKQPPAGPGTMLPGLNLPEGAPLETDEPKDPRRLQYRGRGGTIPAIAGRLEG